LFGKFRRGTKAKEARQKKIEAFQKKQQNKKGHKTTKDAPPVDPAVEDLVPPAPEQAPAAVDDSDGPLADLAKMDATAPTEEPPNDENEEDDGNEADNETDDVPSVASPLSDEGTNSPHQVMSEETNPVSVIGPPRKITARDGDEQSQTSGASSGGNHNCTPALLCGCIYP